MESGPNFYTDLTFREFRSSSARDREFRHCRTGANQGGLTTATKTKHRKYDSYFPAGRSALNKFLVLAVSSLGWIHKEGVSFIKKTLGSEVGARYTEDLSCLTWKRLNAMYDEYKFRCDRVR
jgi:hypothetical protein